MKVAIVHDYLIAEGGAEKVLRAFLDIFPDAPIYTLFYNRKKFKELRRHDIKVSFLNKIPFLKKMHQLFIPVYPLGIGSLKLKDYDLILSTSWGWSKGIKKNKGICHICYCCTPMRFAYNMQEAHLRHKGKIVKTVTRRIFDRLRKWDLSTTERVDFFISISRTARDRILQFYNRDSITIPPPVDTRAFKPNIQAKRGDYFLIASRLVPYKHIDIAIKAFNELGSPLKITGAGSEFKRLKRMAGRNIELLGFVSQEALIELYQDCRAFILPQEEDWGIAAIEALACGKPIIAYAKGGALEYILEGRTGHFFYEQSPEAMIKAVKEFQDMNFDSIQLRQVALLFDKDVFKKRIEIFVKEKYEEFCSNCRK
ncbi:MAG: glycosyltransferase [Candidatus Omnitrophota bacterium]|nr:MAG: glycosyltransferase [Candidatus Omnitrophota bacterium]